MAAAEAILWSVLTKYVPKDVKILPESLQEFWVRTKARGKGPEIDWKNSGLGFGRTEEITWGKQ
jgi:hypothetical protein